MYLCLQIYIYIHRNYATVEAVDLKQTCATSELESGQINRKRSGREFRSGEAADGGQLLIRNTSSPARIPRPATSR